MAEAWGVVRAVARWVVEARVAEARVVEARVVEARVVVARVVEAGVVAAAAKEAEVQLRPHTRRAVVQSMIGHSTAHLPTC
jgi:hypothetical protein